MNSQILLVVAYGILLGVIFNIFLSRHRLKKEHITLVNADEFEKIKGKSQLIDVRTKKEYNEKKIVGSRNIPLSDIKNAETKLFKDKPVYVYCASGKRASKAATILAKKGFNEIVVMRDLLSNYKGNVK